MTSLKRKYETPSSTSEANKKLEDIKKRVKQTSATSPQKKALNAKITKFHTTTILIKRPKNSLSVDYLPDEVILHIFEYFLDFKNRLTAAKVCHRWNGLISHSWKQYFLHQFGNSWNKKQISQEYKHIGQKKGTEVQAAPDWRLLSFSFARFVRELQRKEDAIECRSILEEYQSVFDPLASILVTVSRTGLPLSEFRKIATKHQVVCGDRPKSEITKDIEKKIFDLVETKMSQLMKRRRSKSSLSFFSIQPFLAVQILFEDNTIVIPLPRPSAHFFRAHPNPSIFVVGQLSKVTNSIPIASAPDNITLLEASLDSNLTSCLEKAEHGDIILLCPGIHQAPQLLIKQKNVEILPLDPRSKTIVDVAKINIQQSFVRIANLKFPNSRFRIGPGSRLILENNFLIKEEQNLLEIEGGASSIIHNNVIQVPEASYFRTYQVMEADSNLHALSIRNNTFMVPLQTFKFLKQGEETQGWIRKSVTQKTSSVLISMDFLPSLTKPNKRIDISGNTLKQLELKQQLLKHSKIVF